LLRLRSVRARTMFTFFIVLLKNRWEEIHASQPHDRRDLRRRPHVLDGRIRAARGTAQEARGMLDKAVAAVKADQVVAIAMFLKGEGGSWTAICIHSVSESRTGRPSPVRRLFQLARTLEPLRTPMAVRMVRQSTLRDRSRKVKSLRWGPTCFQSRVPLRRRFRK